MKFDVAIIGAGPAGLSAGIFTARAGLSTICFEKLAVGGQASLSHEIANYPGFESISGFDLTEKMCEQALKNGMQLEYASVQSLEKIENEFEIKTRDKTFKANKVIIANGCKVRKLGIPNEQRLTGRGVSYCASCDGGFFKDKIVAVVGGGNTAIGNVEYLSRIAKKIYLINRTENFRAGNKKVEKIKSYSNVEIITSAVVEELIGDKTLEEIQINNNGNKQRIKLDGVFIAIGYEPDLSFIKLTLKLDDAGYIKVDKNQKTNIKNLYACGDTTSKGFKQVITACADGARAGNSCVGV